MQVKNEFGASRKVQVDTVKNALFVSVFFMCQFFLHPS